MTSSVHPIIGFFYSGKSSSVHWLPDRQCPSSFHTTATPNNGIIQTSQAVSCLLAKQKIVYKSCFLWPWKGALVSFKIMGQKLMCSPLRGMGALGIGHCRMTGNVQVCLAPQDTSLCLERVQVVRTNTTATPLMRQSFWTYLDCPV